jgi:hypothetical protein
VRPDPGDHDRALADGGGDALDRSGADVADGEDARARGGVAVAGRHEALGVEIDEAGEPAGVRRRADHHEEAGGRDALPPRGG